MVTKRGKHFYLRIRPFGGKEVGVKTQARSKTEAKQIEMAVMTACRSGDYRSLDPLGREVCVRTFRNQGWELPADLGMEQPVTDELTLWQALQILLKDPDVAHSPNRERLEQCFVHIVKKWGKEFPVRSIRIPQIKLYRVERLQDGAAPATVNREKSALSKMFQVLIENDMVDRNPVRDVKNLSEKSGERQVYIGFKDFQAICEAVPVWYRPVVYVAFYTGMRRGEILGLRRDQVNVDRRIILIGPEDTKEGDWKRVPIHLDLVPTIEQAMRIQSIKSGEVFLKDGLPLSPGNGRRPWEQAVKAAGLNPAPRFHDLRHTWKTNARRSGIDPEIRESILGHWFKEKSVIERYGRISDQELLSAIDRMTFDHGDTEIVVSVRRKENPDNGSHPASGNLRTIRVQNRF